MFYAKMAAVFFTIILLIHFKWPLWGAVLIASLETALFYGISMPDLLTMAGTTLVSRSCLELLFITYGLILLQNLMERQQMLLKAKDSIASLCSSEALSAAVAPAMVGLLPAPGSVLIAGSMVRDSCEGKLDPDHMAFITTYFRHIPEALLPVYTNVILMCAVSRVPEWKFLLFMLPYTLFNAVIPYWIYLRPAASKMEIRESAEGPLALLGHLAQNMWPVFLIIFLILAVRIPTALAVLAVILLLFIASRSFKDAPELLKKSLDWHMLLMVATILIFTEILGHTEAPAQLLAGLEALPIPAFLVYGLIMLSGSILSNFTAMIPVVFPAALAAGSGSLSMTILLASAGHLASQLCPTHICLTLCADQFRTTINRIFLLTIPVTAIMFVLSCGIYVVMRGMGL